MAVAKPKMKAAAFTGLLLLLSVGFLVGSIATENWLREEVNASSTCDVKKCGRCTTSLRRNYGLWHECYEKVTEWNVVAGSTLNGETSASAKISDCEYKVEVSLSSGSVLQKKELLECEIPIETDKTEQNDHCNDERLVAKILWIVTVSLFFLAMCAACAGIKAQPAIWGAVCLGFFGVVLGAASLFVTVDFMNEYKYSCSAVSRIQRSKDFPPQSITNLATLPVLPGSNPGGANSRDCDQPGFADANRLDNSYYQQRPSFVVATMGVFFGVAATALAMVSGFCIPKDLKKEMYYEDEQYGYDSYGRY